MSALIKTENLKVYFPVKTGVLKKTSGYIRAVDNVSITINSGETLGLVGESGCGKSTLGRAILRLIEPTDGKIFYNNINLLDLNPKEMRIKRKDLQIVFQDPYSSLNPRMTVLDAIAEALLVHKLSNKKELKNKVINILNNVGLTEADLKKYPHEFSGGQRQRIGIARALAVEPKFIVADEPVSALDVSVQSQILNLLSDLRKDMNLSMLFISHDLRVIKHMANRVAVMYLGKIVEIADAKDLYKTPLHPYTKALLSAVPIPDPKLKRMRIILKGDVPNPANPPTGCAFHPRCPEVMEKCSSTKVSLIKQAGNRECACLKYL